MRDRISGKGESGKGERAKGETIRVN